MIKILDASLTKMLHALASGWYFQLTFAMQDVYKEETTFSMLLFCCQSKTLNSELINRGVPDCEPVISTGLNDFG